jgi:hypothetical protein
MNSIEVIKTRQRTGTVRKLLRDLDADIWDYRQDGPERHYPAYCVDTSSQRGGYTDAWFTYFDTTPEVFAEIKERLARLDRETTRSGLREAAGQRYGYVETYQPIDDVRHVLSGLGLHPTSINKPYCVISLYHLTEPGGLHRPKYLFFGGTPDDLAAVRAALARLDRHTAASGLREGGPRGARAIVETAWRENEIKTSLGIDAVAVLVMRFSRPRAMNSDVYLIWCTPGSTPRYPVIFPVAVRTTPEQAELLRLEIERLERTDTAWRLREGTARGARAIIESHTAGGLWEVGDARTFLTQQPVSVIRSVLLRCSCGSTGRVGCAAGPRCLRYQPAHVWFREVTELADDDLFLGSDVYTVVYPNAYNWVLRFTAPPDVAECVRASLARLDRAEAAGQLKEMQVEWDVPPDRDVYAWARDTGPLLARQSGPLLARQSTAGQRVVTIRGLTIPADVVLDMLDRQLGPCVLRWHDTYSYATQGDTAVTIVVYSRGNWTPTLFAFKADEDVVTGIIRQLEQEERRWTAIMLKEDTTRRVLHEALPIQIYTNQCCRRIQAIMRDLGLVDLGLMSDGGWLWRTNVEKQQRRFCIITSRDRSAEAWFPVYADLTQEEAELIRHQLAQLDRAAARRELRT